MEGLNRSPVSGPTINNFSTNSSQAHLSSTDKKTKNVAFKAFDWLWRNKLDVTVGIISASVLVISVPLVVMGGAVVLLDILPVIIIASIFFGLSVFDITSNAIREHKIKLQCKNLEKTIENLEVYRNKIPSDKEIEDTLTLSELIEIIEKWKNNYAELRNESSESDAKLFKYRTLFNNDMSCYLDSMKKSFNKASSFEEKEKVRVSFVNYFKTTLLPAAKKEINDRIIDLSRDLKELENLEK